AHEMAVTARGLAKAAEILAGEFTLVATNVPYLGIRKQAEELIAYCERVHPSARHDLATVFVERCVGFACGSGTVAVVTPQNWLSIQSYKTFREELLASQTWGIAAPLGTGAFETISGEVVNVGLFIISRDKPTSDHYFAAADARIADSPRDKANTLSCAELLAVKQLDQFKNPDTRVIFEASSYEKKLSDFAQCLAGIQNGDSPTYLRGFWELPHAGKRWAFQQTAVTSRNLFGGMDTLIDYDMDEGHLRADAEWRREALHDSDQRGKPFWGKRGVLVSRMGSLPCTLYLGNPYDQASGVIVPHEVNHLAAIWAFCSSEEYNKQVRKLDRKVNVTSATLAKVPFDLAHWRKVAAEKYPHGLPKPFSSDPTQWLFNGHPAGADQPLHVAVARLLGSQWPRQTGSSFPDCPALGPDGLETLADDDGIVCLDALQGELSAAERLRAVLATAYGSDWSPAKQAELLGQVGAASLDQWLREKFFEQHCALFRNRPFVWHIWDGMKNGFHALVNYHRLAAPNGEGRRTLEKLIYSYLGDWIKQQRDDQKNGFEGADARVAAAEHLKKQLELILHGEPPYDIFVRWKPLHEQPIGWAPDVNDGVRLNIRPFMTATPLNSRSKTACLLRATPKIKWEKDRGKEPSREKQDFPWFWSWDQSLNADFTGGQKFDGNRWNDLHFSNSFKHAARERKAVLDKAQRR
ncbi:MAG TPA: SAM-dependent DNA methyltransferase, partial [Terriglobales bacterium]